MSDKGKVTVLLAVYNGEKYLREMLLSLVNQTYGNYEVILSDDGSTDGSQNIINEFCESYKDIFTKEPAHEKNGSASRHFMYLLNKYKDREMIMFADQDDVWLPSKIEKSVESADLSLPCLVHCDCTLCDSRLGVIDPSFHRYSGLSPCLPFNKMLLSNCVQGSSMLINNKLSELVCGEYDPVIHDWWIAKIASSEGKIIYIDEQLFLYRQHGDNQIGAENKPMSLKYMLKKVFRSDIRKSIDAVRREAGKVSGYVSGDNAAAAAELFRSIGQSKIKRISVMKKYDMLPDNFFNKMKFIIWG